VEDYKIQTIDPTLKADTSLEVVEFLPKFTGEPTQYVGWREAAETIMSPYKILRIKSMGDAHDTLTNHGTVLNFRAF